MTAPPPPITVVLADPREIFRDGLATALASHPGLSIIASVATLEEAVSACRTNRVSVMLMGELFSEYDLGPSASLLAGLPPETRTILICHDVDRVTELIEAGFWGCLSQTASAAEVTRAVEAVAQGEFWAPRQVLSQLVRERLFGCSYSGSEGAASTALTRREAEILELVARGYNNEQIAVALFIGRSTVKTHLLRSFRKLDAVDRTSAVTIALQRKLIPPG